MNTFLALLKAVSALIELVRAIEAAVPEGGKGKAKLELILAVVDQIGAEVKDLPIEKLRAIVTNVVSTIVGFLNAVGAFRKAQ